MQLEFSPLVHHPMLILGTMLQRRSCMLSSAFSSLWGWFTSQGRKCIGNKVNRWSFPKELILPNRCPRGTYKYRNNGPLLACAWFDKRPVYFLSTSHVTVPSGGLSTVKRSDGPNKVDVPCPPLLEDYIKFMRGVDRGDQLITLYNAWRRSKKWWRRILFHMIEVCLLNGYALEGCVKPRSCGHKKRDLLSFRIEVAEMLIGAYRGRKWAGRKQKRDEDRFEPTLQHLPVYGDSLGDCVVCTKKGGTWDFKRGFPPSLPLSVQLLQCSPVHDRRPQLFLPVSLQCGVLVLSYTCAETMLFIISTSHSTDYILTAVSSTRIKNIKNVSRCKDSRSA